MPRLNPRLVQHAARINCHLPILLRECRDFRSAQNELRWIKEHIQSKFCLHEPSSFSSSIRGKAILKHYVDRRARGEPLQYILGTQPFGDLEILCKPGVLIPRPETETYTTLLVDTIQTLRKDAREVISDDGGPLKIADFCTGTGCIALSLHASLRPPRRRSESSQCEEVIGAVQIHGYDVSPDALNLAKTNLEHNCRLGLLCETVRKEVLFEMQDVLALAAKFNTSSKSCDYPHRIEQCSTTKFDVIVSNPPYISPKDFKASGTTTRSVRKFEPKLALVPPPLIEENNDLERADQFYGALLNIALASGTRLLVMEVGDDQQAHRVRSMLEDTLQPLHMTNATKQQYFIETWRDDGHVQRYEGNNSDAKKDPMAANDRAIVLWLGNWVSWRRGNCAK